MVAMTAQDNEIVEMLGLMGLASSTALGVAFFFDCHHRFIIQTGGDNIIHCWFKSQVIILIITAEYRKRGDKNQR
jgi:hypothetical protein